MAKLRGRRPKLRGVAGRIIKEARLSAGLRQVDIMRWIDLSQGEISRIENGHFGIDADRFIEIIVRASKQMKYPSKEIETLAKIFERYFQ